MRSFPLLLLLACPTDPTQTAEVDSGEPAGTDSADTGAQDTGTLPPPIWDEPAAAVFCNQGESAPLYDLALADAEISRENVGFTDALWASYEPYVAGPFQLPWFASVHHEPEFAACFVRQVAADLDTAAVGAYPLASAIRAMAVQAGLTPAGEPVDAGNTSLKDAIKALKEAAGGGQDSDMTAELPADLAEALTPIILAMSEGIIARHEMDSATEAWWSPRTLFSDAAGILIYDSGYLPKLTDEDEVEAFADWYTGETGPRRLLGPAAQIAIAIENANLGRFGGTDTSWVFETDAGIIRIWPSTDDTHEFGDAQVLLDLDLGGNDIYLDGAGSNLSEENPVAISIDLGGMDTYGYVAVGDEDDVAGALISDEDGRRNSSGYAISSSDQNRQGAGRYGIGMLMDLGGENDTYASLRMSQGFGTLGVGVLYDDGGDDTYSAEAGVQGSAVYGYGLLLDGGGADAYTAWAYAQGFGFVGSAGVLLDIAGDDIYWSDPGNSFGGTTLYYSPQLPGGEGNSSFSQGAGFGLRGDAYGQWFSGGVGILRDSAGNDVYTAGVFSQATGYWEGVGILSDGAGDDTYDALYYMQGGSAHFAAALFNDQAGNDQYGLSFDSYYMHTGAGHDFSLGLFIEDGGNDAYAYGGLSIGASNCQGVGIFVERAGDDSYAARSDYSTGLGNHSGECAARTAEQSTGIFLDGAGGRDRYSWFDGNVRTPANDAVFGIEWAGTSDEHGGAADGAEEPGF